MSKLLIAVGTLFTSLSLLAGPACCAAPQLQQAGDEEVAKPTTVAAVATTNAHPVGEDCPPGMVCPANMDCASNMKALGKAHEKMMAAKEAKINTSTLKETIDAKKSVVILDARTSKYDDGQRIPGAQLIGPNPDDDQLAKLLPDKDAMIVTYCGGVKCPLGGKLAAKLRAKGYTNVLEYSEGIAGWLAAGHPVESTNVN